jgi:hypothetical protein
VLQSGSFTTTGTIIAQTINVQQVTSSVVYSSGSNVFGNSLGNSQVFTGSVLITGSLTIAGASSATSYSGTTIYGSTVVCSPVGFFSGCVGIGTVSPGTRLEVVATGENVLKLKNSGGQPSLVRFNDTSTTLDPYIGSYGNDLAFGTYGGGEKMRITNGGNLGLGVTPSAWASPFISFSVGNKGAALSGRTDVEQANFSSNWYFDGASKYIITGYSTLYQQTNGSHIWFQAPSGTAGCAITFCQAMTLNASGNLLVGTSTAPTAIAVNDLLVIGKSGSASNAINFSNGSTTNWGYLLAESGKMVLGSGASSNITFETNAGSERMRITSAGIACFASTVCTPSLVACVTSAAAITIDGYSKLSFKDRGTEYGTINASRYNFGGESTLFTFQSGNCFLFLNGTNCLMFIGSNGNVGIGTSSPSQQLSFGMLTNSATRTYTTDNQGTLSFYNLTTGNLEAYLDITSVRTGNDDTLGGANIRFLTQTVCSITSACERMRITSSGQVAIGATSNLNNFTIKSSSDTITSGGMSFQSRTAVTNYIAMGLNSSNDFEIQTWTTPSWLTRMYIKNNGNIGIGTTTPQAKLQVSCASNFGAILKISDITTESTGIIALGDGNTSVVNVGIWRAAANSMSSYGNWLNLGGYDGILFATCALGIGSQAERMRITSGGNVAIGRTDDRGYRLSVQNSNATVLNINRLTSDGSLIDFEQENALEGSISVSGTTVSYNSFLGSHWSQLQDGSKIEILKGTIIEAIDEMCIWEDETNDRLPKSKISDTAESKNVYGVFLAWDENWKTSNDFYVAAVGLGYIRVNSSQNISMGDLLQSNGDGTAKIQKDDIMRSSTIAKVVSTQKIETYEDGSYLIAATLHCG